MSWAIGIIALALFAVFVPAMWLGNQVAAVRRWTLRIRRKA